MNAAIEPAPLWAALQARAHGLLKDKMGASKIMVDADKDIAFVYQGARYVLLLHREDPNFMVLRHSLVEKEFEAHADVVTAACHAASKRVKLPKLVHTLDADGLDVHIAVEFLMHDPEQLTAQVLERFMEATQIAARVFFREFDRLSGAADAVRETPSVRH